MALAGAVVVGVIVHLLAVRGSVDAHRVVAIFVALGALLFLFRASHAVAVAAALVAAWLFAVVLVKDFSHVFDPQPPVSQAIGAAAFLDTPYRAPQLGAVLSVAIPALIVLVSVVPAIRRGTLGASAQTASASSKPAPAFRQRLTLWVGAALLALTIVPDLRTAANVASLPLPYDWDQSNLVAWQGFIQMGFVPMKDFFYPYGYQWLFSLRNFGPLLEWFSQVALLGIAAWSLWRLTGGRVSRALLCLLALLLAARWNPGVWRYIPALLVAVSYAAIGPARHARLVRGHLLFGAACLLAAFLEPDLLLLGVIGAVLVAVGELVGGQLAWQPRALVRSLAIDAIPLIGAGLIIVLSWVLTGTTTGNLHFFGEFTAVSAQSAPDELLYGPLGRMVVHPNAYALDAAIPALVVVAGLLLARLKRDAAVAAIQLGAGGVALGIVLKHLVRPVDDYTIAIPLVALAWAAIINWRRDSLLRAAASGAALGALLTLANEQGGVSNYFSTVFDSPSHAVRSIGFLTDYHARVRAGKARFAPARFPLWPDSIAVGAYAEAVPTRPLPPFAAIGDLQMTYVLLRERPPYQINMYDAGRLDEQRTMVSLLARRQPPYLLWRRDFAQDGIAYAVRDPLVYTWMVANYVPVHQFQYAPPPGSPAPLAIDVLRRRAPGEPPATSYFTAILGPTVALGYVPSLSPATGAPSCNGGGGCAPYAVMHGTPARAREQLAFSIKSGAATYSVALFGRRGVSDYPVRLDRLWFWRLLGPNPTLAPLTPRFSVRRVSLSTGTNLY